MLPAPHAEDGRVAIGAALGATDIAGGAFVCGSSSAGASTGSPSARKNFITSSSPCCRDSLSSPLKGSVTCVLRVLDREGQAHLPRRISESVGLKANHGNGLSHERAAGRPKPLASAGTALSISSRFEDEWCQVPLCSRASR